MNFNFLEFDTVQINKKFIVSIKTLYLGGEHMPDYELCIKMANGDVHCDFFATKEQLDNFLKANFY